MRPGERQEGGRGVTVVGGMEGGGGGKLLQGGGEYRAQVWIRNQNNQHFLWETASKAPHQGNDRRGGGGGLQ